VSCQTGGFFLFNTGQAEEALALYLYKEFINFASIIEADK
jgi:hypothetical protein